ncbi:Sorting nexin-29 [Gryllus bimaculatus]|nr:Sorting nexin-29 [Gryllus bimaculatus]
MLCAEQEMSQFAAVPEAGQERVRERQRLLAGLLEAVKECQVRFGGRAELATEADGRVVELCSCMEEALAHGLRARPLSASKSGSTLRHVTDLVSNSLNFSRGSPQETSVFWHYVREHLTRHELERYLLLKQVWTDTGRGRAWLRAALNERSLERYLQCLLANPQHVAMFYEDWAFLQDPERSATLPTMAAGLGSILFAISIDNPQLNLEACAAPEGEATPSLCPEPVIPASKGLESTGKRRSEQKRRRRVQPQIISFGDDDDGSAVGSPPIGTPSAQEASPSGDGSDAGSMDEAVPRVVSADGQRTRPGHLPLSTSPALAHRLEAALRVDARASAGAKVGAQTLTPVTNVSVGELIPVTLVSEEAYSEEDSLSVPSYSEDTECAAAALLATQKLLQSNCVDFSPQESSAIVQNSPMDVVGSLSGEMRDALLTVLARKEELQAEVRSLRRLLEQAEERSTHLQAEAEASQRSQAERMQRLDARTQALTRENELLKHQLRKYVGAVQLLKRDGQQAHEALASLQVIQQTRPGEILAPDYHHEAREYEKKLIQDARFVEERRRRLQHYLRCVVNHLVQTSAELAANPDKEVLIGLVPFFGVLVEFDVGSMNVSSSKQ